MNQQCTLLYLRHGQKLLLAMKKRGHGVGKWNGVGGKVKPNETVEECASRECTEEIRVIPSIVRKVAIHDFVNSNPESNLNQRVHVYICDQWNGKPEETEEMAPRWFDLDNIPYDDMWEDDRIWLPLILEGKMVQGKFSFNDSGEMLNSKLNIVRELT